MPSAHSHDSSSTPYRPLAESGVHQEIMMITDDEESQIESENPQKTIHHHRWRLVSNCLMGFSNGITDSVPGALLPYIQDDYDVKYGVVSLIFVANALGYLFAAPQVHSVDTKAGRAGAYAISQVLMGIGFLLLVSHIGFHVTIIAFWFIGLGEALNLALNNVFCAGQKAGTSALGLLHGCYGAGGTVGPLLATSMVVHNIEWSSFYWVTLLCTILNGSISAILWGYEKECQDAEQGHLLREEELSASPRGSHSVENRQPIDKGQGIFREAIQNRTTILGAVFIFAYQGAEVSISGWMIEFLISYRSGNPAVVGYVTVGFWAGISLGRFLISPFAQRMGDNRAVIFMVLACILLQIMVWFMRSIIANAVATVIVGLLLGPVYPCAISIFGRTLPPNLHLTSLSVISAMGSSGGAVVPLCVGLLAQRFGTVVLHPLCVLMYVIMFVSWVALPTIREEPERS